MYYRSVRSVKNINCTEKSLTGSKTINTLMTIYLSTILIFTASVVLNVISQFFFILAFGGCAVHMVMKNKKFKYDTFLLVFAAFIFYCLLSVIWSKDTAKALEKVITLVQLFALSIILFSYICAYNNIDVFIRGVLIAGIIGAWVVIEYYGFSEFFRLMMKGYRLGGMINNQNSIGMFSATAVIISFFYIYFRGKKYGFLLMILPLLTVFSSGSRKALAMTVLGICILAFMKYRERIRLTSFLKFIGILLLLIVIVYFLSTVPAFRVVFDRIESMLASDGGFKDISTIQREEMIKAGWKYFLNNPLFGIGIGNSHVITREEMGMNTYLHNNYIELLATVGIIGFLLYYSMYFYFLKGLYILAIRKQSSSSALIFSMLLTQFVMEFGAVLYYDKMTYVYFTMAAATIVTENRRIEAEVQEYLSEGNEAEAIKDTMLY